MKNGKEHGITYHGLQHAGSVPAGLAGFVGLVVFFAACGGSPYGTISVEGRVTYNGDTLVGGSVMFYPTERGKGRPASAKIDPDGTFVVKTFSNASGLIPGDYKIGVTSRRPFLPRDKPENVEPTDANPLELPARFNNPETSGLRFTVAKDAGAQTYNIDLSD